MEQNVVTEILEYINVFLQADVDSEDAVEFSIRLEDMLCDRYDEMKATNPFATKLLNENLPDLCADCEEGMDVSLFKERIKKEMDVVAVLVIPPKEIQGKIQFVRHDVQVKEGIILTDHEWELYCKYREELHKALLIRFEN